jgi:RNA-directed DNA polymerase
MSLATPIAIRTLQRKLYRKAKAEPAFRFYLLYDKIYREDILRHAYALVRFNAGAPGVDGMTFAAIEASGLEEWLAGLREELVLKRYRPNPVRRAMIPKPDGGERPLGIPTIRDRVVQTAAEADLEDNAYGYRPVRGTVDAVEEVHRLICRGHTDVVDADLAGGCAKRAALLYALIGAPITPRRVGDIPAPGGGPVGGAGEWIWPAKSP